MVRRYMAGAERSGYDVRLDLGIPFKIKVWSRVSIPPSSWRWHVALAYPWRQPCTLRINALELAAVLNTVRWASRSSTFRKVRFFHCVDSQVCSGVLSKGRTSSGSLQLPLAQLSALLVCIDGYATYGYVNTHVNPADLPSRIRWDGKSRRPASGMASRPNFGAHVPSCDKACHP